MAYHTVRQGECLSSISERYGFKWQTLWDDEHNSDLKRERHDPNVLYPDDVVYIPDKRLKEESGATDQRHHFKLTGVPAKLRIRLMADDEPRCHERYTLDVDGRLFTGETDGDGWLKQSVP